MDYFEEKKSKDGKIYYQNKINGQTQWGYNTFFKTQKKLPKGWIRLYFKGHNPVYIYIGNRYTHSKIFGGGGGDLLRPSSVISMSYKDLLHKEDPEGNYKAEAFRRFFLFEKVADLLKSTTESIGDESLQYLAIKASVSLDEIIAYIERKEREDLGENATQTAFQKIRESDVSFLTERSIRELCGVNMKEEEFSKAMNQLDGLSCYIHHSILKDPVICSNGQTYERESIQSWLVHNNTCPKTRDHISDILVTNYALRNVLDDFVKRYENQRGTIWKPIRDECVEYQNFMNTVGRVKPVPTPVPTPVRTQVRTPIRTPEPPGPAFLSIEHRRDLASLPDLYIDPRLESWENMNIRYERFNVDRYDTFGFGLDGLGFSRSDNRERYERFITEEGCRFFVGSGFELRRGRYPLPLTQEQQLQIQHIDNILARSQREMHGY